MDDIPTPEEWIDAVNAAGMVEIGRTRAFARFDWIRAGVYRPLLYIPLDPGAAGYVGKVAAAIVWLENAAAQGRRAQAVLDRFDGPAGTGLR